MTLKKCPRCGGQAHVDLQIDLPQEMNDGVRKTAAVAGKFAINHVSKVAKTVKHPAIAIPLAVVGGVALVGAAVAGNHFLCDECGHRYSVLDQVSLKPPKFLRNPFGFKAS